MMRGPIILLCIALVLASPCLGVEVYLKADFKNASSAESFIYVGLDGRDAVPCVLPDPAPKDFLSGAICSFQVGKGTHDVFVQIKVSGYKRFTRNVPSFEVGDKPSVLDIGVVLLAASEIPRIEDINVAQAFDESQSYLVRVDLLNSSKKSFFIRNVLLSATEIDVCAGPGRQERDCQGTNRDPNGR
jgi:hypothetical protein